MGPTLIILINGFILMILCGPPRSDCGIIRKKGAWKWTEIYFLVDDDVSILLLVSDAGGKTG